MSQTRLHHPISAGENVEFSGLIRYVVDHGIGLDAPDPQSGLYRWTVNHPAKGKPKTRALENWCRETVPGKDRRGSLDALLARIDKAEGKSAPDWRSAIERAYSGYWRKIEYAKGPKQATSSLELLFQKAGVRSLSGLSMQRIACSASQTF